MTEDSGFFECPADLQLPEGTELLHRSRDGWSEIWRTLSDGRFRVLKALKPEFRGKTMYESLLRKEYEIAAPLSHPGIREVYGFSSRPGLGKVIEMEWVDGCTLEELMSGGTVPRREALRLADQLCDAVSYLHSRQIVHRDIKPSNILVTHNGKNIKLIDFGLSDSDSWAVLKGSCGTRAFAAPEMLAGPESDCRSDIWSLGKVTGMLLPARRQAVRKATATSPDKRFQDVESFRRALHGKLRLWIVPLSGAILAAVLFFATRRPAEVQLPLPVQDTTEVKTIDDPELIDELFRQATEMIESR